MGGVGHWLWRAGDEDGIVLGVLRQRHRATGAARTFWVQQLGEFHVPEPICTNRLASDGAAIQAIPVLEAVDHQQVISTARCHHLTLQSHRATRRQERSQLGLRKPKRTQEFLNLHARIANLHRQTRTTVSAHIKRRNQQLGVQVWRKINAGVACSSGPPYDSSAGRTIHLTEPATQAIQ